MRPRAMVASKGRVAIPKQVRERLELRLGDEVESVEDGRGFRLQKRAAVSLFQKYRGDLKHLTGYDPDEFIEKMHGG